ncbi:MAG: hypothetical protein N6V49_12475 [Serratia symbiotica]|nr:hypothetical protein [Serratia symbiotica]
MSFSRSPQSLTGVSAWGLIPLIPEVQPTAQRKRCSNRFPTGWPLTDFWQKYTRICVMPVT